MAAPLLVVVGHCTESSARIFCCAPHGSAAARIAWHAAGRSGAQDLQLTAASPYAIGVFDLRGLPASAVVTYGLDVAEDAASLRAAESMLATGARTRTVRLLRTDRPLRLGLVSCNGAFQVADRTRRYALWRKLGDLIDQGDVDVLIHCGDQIYADAVYTNHRTTASEVAALTEEYRRWYVEQAWAAPEVAAVLASVPNVMTWDDHDIYDGYGCHDEDGAPVPQALLKAAAQAYSEFQISHGPATLGPSGQSFLTGFVHGGVGVLLLDTRLNRLWKNGTILGAGQIESIQAWLDTHAPDLTHLFVVVSVPLVHAKVAAALKLMEIVPGRQELEDDLRDCWTARNNRAECATLCERLFATLATHHGLQITLLSGDVHMGAVAELESLRASHGQAAVRRIYQVTSSGIGSPAIGGLGLWALRMLLTSSWIELGSAEFRGRLLRLHGIDDLVVETRNFAVVRLDAGDAASGSHRNVYVDFHAETAEGTDTNVWRQTLEG